MDGEFWSDTANMLIAGAIVAAVSLPVGLVAWRSVQRNSKPLLLPWLPYRGPWSGLEVIFAFFVVFILIPETIAMVLVKTEIFAAVPQDQAETATIIRFLWSRVLALPLQLTILLGTCRVLYPQWWFQARPTLAAQVVVALVAWMALTPLVLGTNALVNVVFALLQWQRDTHPLVKLGGRPLHESVLFVIQACIAAPIIEEAMFRGLILAWVMGRKAKSSFDVPEHFRPWLVVLIAIAFAAISLRDGVPVFSGQTGATLFILVLAVGLAVVFYLFKTKRRTVGGVYSSAALFAAIHSAIWPSPIPLFLLGLGLGWLAVRTRSLLVPIIVHGLFNAVSTVYVLRGS